MRRPDGQPTGVLIDNAMALVEQKIPLPAARELRRQIKLAADLCLTVGLTTVTDMGIGRVVGSGAAELEAYTQARATGELPLRVAVFLNGDDRALIERWFSRGPLIDPEGLLYVRGVKLYADGALGSRGAALLEPYSDDPANVGLCWRAERPSRKVSSRRARQRLPGRHPRHRRPRQPGGARRHRARLRRPAPARGALPARARPGDAHAGHRAHGAARAYRLDAADPRHLRHAVGRSARRGARGSTAPTPGARCSTPAARLALGSDFPVESARSAARPLRRGDPAGPARASPTGGWLPGERLTREEALRGFTLDAA